MYSYGTLCTTLAQCPLCQRHALTVRMPSCSLFADSFCSRTSASSLVPFLSHFISLLLVRLVASCSRSASAASPRCFVLTTIRFCCLAWLLRAYDPLLLPLLVASCLRPASFSRPASIRQATRRRARPAPLGTNVLIQPRTQPSRVRPACMRSAPPAAALYVSCLGSRLSVVDRRLSARCLLLRPHT